MLKRSIVPVVGLGFCALGAVLSACGDDDDNPSLPVGGNDSGVDARSSTTGDSGSTNGNGEAGTDSGPTSGQDAGQDSGGPNDAGTDADADAGPPSCFDVPGGSGCTGVFVSAAIGDDSNPGTAAAPLKTVATAIALAKTQSAKIVFIAEGTYVQDQNIVLVEGVSLAGGYACSAAPCTWTRDTKSHASKIVFDGNNATGGITADSSITAATRIDGLEIYGDETAGSSDVTSITLRDGVPTIRGNTIALGSSATGGDIVGIDAVTGTKSVSITGNSIYGGSSTGKIFSIAAIDGTASIVGNLIVGGRCSDDNCVVRGIHGAHGNTIIRQNTIVNGSGTKNASGGAGDAHGITVIASSSSVGTLVIDRNHFNDDKNNAAGGCATGRCSAIYILSGEVTITNNVILGPRAPLAAGILNASEDKAIVVSGNYISGGGIVASSSGMESAALYVQNYASTLRVRNNILMGGMNPKRYCVYQSSDDLDVLEANDFAFELVLGTTDTLYSYNFTSITTESDIASKVKTKTLNAGNVAKDPGVDSSFHLLSTSPLIDQGTSNDAPATDIDGESRPHGAKIDIGADEHY